MSYASHNASVALIIVAVFSHKECVQFELRVLRILTIHLDYLKSREALLWPGH